MSRQKYNFSFSFTNVVTIVSAVVFALTALATLQISIASANQDRKDMRADITKNENAIHQVVKLREDIIRVTVNQEHLTRQIASVLDYLKQNNKRLHGE